MSEETRIILGAPYVFARYKLQKPHHTETVRLVQRPALCHNGCGLYYVPNADPLPPGSTCPDCGAPPKPWSLGEPDEVEVLVHMAFGNLRDVTFLRTLGAVSRRTINMPVARGTVTIPK